LDLEFFLYLYHGDEMETFRRSHGPAREMIALMKKVMEHQGQGSAVTFCTFLIYLAPQFALLFPSNSLKYFGTSFAPVLDR
jgi:hypothetical protein